MAARNTSWFLSGEMFGLFQFEKQTTENCDCGDAGFDALPKLRRMGAFCNDSNEVEAFVVVIRFQSPYPSTLNSTLALS